MHQLQPPKGESLPASRRYPAPHNTASKAQGCSAVAHLQQAVLPLAPRLLLFRELRQQLADVEHRHDRVVTPRRHDAGLLVHAAHAVERAARRHVAVVQLRLLLFIIAGPLRHVVIVARVAVGRLQKSHFSFGALGCASVGSEDEGLHIYYLRPLADAALVNGHHVKSATQASKLAGAPACRGRPA